MESKYNEKQLPRPPFTRIYVRENRRGNQEWTLPQRNWQHWVHKTQGEDKQSKNTTQYA